MATEYPLRDDAGQIVALQDSRSPVEEVAPQPEPEPRRSRAIAPGDHRPLGDRLPTSQVASATTAPRSQLALYVGVAAVVLIVAIAFWPAAGAALMSPTAAPTTVPTVQPTTAPAGQQLARAVVAYAAPDGTILGALEAGRTYTATARYAADWLQIDAGSGPVWVKLGEVTSDPAALASLPDLAPPPTPTAQPTAIALPQPIYQPPPVAPTRDWTQQPCTPSEVNGRAQQHGVIVESCISQADAEATLGAILAKTAEAKP